MAGFVVQLVAGAGGSLLKIFHDSRVREGYVPW
jgi:hypothetical protein